MLDGSINGNLTVRLKNRLLSSLPSADLKFLMPHLEFVTFPSGKVEGLEADVFFVDSGVAIVQAPEDELSVAFAGKEGALGVFAALGVTIEPFAARAITEITGYRMLAADFCRAADALPATREIMSRYLAAVVEDLVWTTTSAIMLKVQARVAGWLIAVLERNLGADIRVTHHEMSRFIGVRRAGVTDAMHILEGEGAIYSTRGRVTLRNADKLRHLASKSTQTLLNGLDL